MLVSKDQKIILNNGYGLSKQGIRCNADTIYDIGSITKQFTAAAILKLEREGELSVSDCIRKYFSGVPKDKAGITIHHLLTHTGGFQHYYGKDYEVAYRDETLRKMFDTPLKSEPGKKFIYSNGGYSILAALIEKITGISYKEYLSRSFFEPLDMTHTGHPPSDWKESLVVKDKSRGAGPYWHVYGNGGLLSNANDLFHWHVALQENRALSKLQKGKLFTPYVKTDEDESFYGYGWFIDKKAKGDTLISHSGESGEGINSEFLYFTGEDTLILIFSDIHLGCVTAVDVARNVIDKVTFDKHYSMPQDFIEVDRTILQKRTGTYKFPSGAELIVSLKNDRLQFSAENKGAFRQLLFSGEKAYLKKKEYLKLIFMPKSKKKVVSFNFHNLEPIFVTFRIKESNDVEGLTFHKKDGDLFARKIC